MAPTSGFATESLDDDGIDGVCATSSHLLAALGSLSAHHDWPKLDVLGDLWTMQVRLVHGPPAPCWAFG